MTISESKAKGVIKYSRTNNDGEKLYTAYIKTIIYDHSPRNPSLPVVSSCYGEENEPTMAYGLTHDDAVKHINSFGFTGKIITTY
jgi:hypothetical protein